MPRQRDIRTQRRAKEQERQHWTEQRDDEADDSRDVPDSDDDKPSRESMT